MSPELTTAMNALDEAVDRLLQLRGQNASRTECDAAQKAFEDIAGPLKKLMTEHQREQLQKRLTELGKKLA